jgi:hypothetical protein
MNHSIKNIVSLNKTTNFGFITNTDNVFLLISDLVKFRELYSTIQILLNLLKVKFVVFRWFYSTWETKLLTHRWRKFSERNDFIWNFSNANSFLSGARSSITLSSKKFWIKSKFLGNSWNVFCKCVAHPLGLSLVALFLWI